jgi:hypothetical protein
MPELMLASGPHELVEMSSAKLNKGHISTDPEDYKFKGVACKSDEEGNAYWTWLGAIIVPLEVDTQKEASEASGVQWQAWEHCVNGDKRNVDSNHDYVPNGTMVVEEGIARKGDPDFKEGTWWARGLTFAVEIGEKIDSGAFNAWSWAGPVDRELNAARISHPLEASGTTEKSDFGPYPEHDHEVDALKFDDDAKVVPMRTGARHTHCHDIVGWTRTEIKDGHSHALKIVPQE